MWVAALCDSSCCDCGSDCSIRQRYNFRCGDGAVDLVSMRSKAMSAEYLHSRGSGRKACIGDCHTSSDCRNADEGTAERVCSSLVVDFGQNRKSNLAFQTDKLALERRQDKLRNRGPVHHWCASKSGNSAGEGCRSEEQVLRVYEHLDQEGLW